MSASSPSRNWRKAYPSFERRVVPLLGPRMAWLLSLIDGHSQNYRLTNAQLAKELGVSVVYVEKLLSRARRLGLIQSEGKPRAFRGFERRIFVTESCRSWMQGESAPEALLNQHSKISRPILQEGIRPILQEGIRPILQEGSKGDKYTKKRRKEGESPSLPSSVQGFIEAAKRCGLSYQELTQLACRAVKEGLTLEDWKFCVGKATQQAKGKSGLSLGAAIGQLMRARDFVQANHTASMQALEDHIEKNLEALREAVLRSPAAFRGAERVGNTYVGPFGILDLTSSPVQFLTNINKLI